MELSDTAVVRRILDGDTEAFSILVERYYERYLRFASHMLGERADAEEALQDAFLRAYRSLPRYEERDQFGAWLFRIVLNRCRTAAVRRSRRERMFLTGEELPAGISPARQQEYQGLREAIANALEQIGPEQREAFLLKHVEDFSYEEMAAVTGVGVSALKMRVKRACDRLRELLQEVNSV